MQLSINNFKPSTSHYKTKSFSNSNHNTILNKAGEDVNQPTLQTEETASKKSINHKKTKSKMENTTSEFYKTSNTFHTNNFNTRPTTTNNTLSFNETGNNFNKTSKTKFKSIINTGTVNNQNNSKHNNFLKMPLVKITEGNYLKTENYNKDEKRKSIIKTGKFYNLNETVTRNNDYTITAEQLEKESQKELWERDEKELKKLDQWELAHNIHSNLFI